MPLYTVDADSFVGKSVGGVHTGEQEKIVRVEKWRRQKRGKGKRKEEERDVIVYLQLCQLLQQHL